MSDKKLDKFLQKARQDEESPPPRTVRAPILLTDSKGYSLSNCGVNNFPLTNWCEAGANSARLVDILKRKLRPAVEKDGSVLVYFWGGTCDLTTKYGKQLSVRSKDDSTVEDILRQYNIALDFVNKQPKAFIKFVDCPYISVQRWNDCKGVPKESDETEDAELRRQVDLLNNHINELNDKLAESSVKVNNLTKKSKGGKRVKKTFYRINFSLYRDGVHPGPKLAESWKQLIRLNINKSCQVPEQDILQLDTDDDSENI